MSFFVILSPGFPNSEEDTTCLPPVQSFILSIKNQYPNSKIIVIAFQYPFTKKTYTWHGVNVISMAGRNRSKLYRVLIWVKVYLKLLRLNKAEKINGILSLWVTECALIGKMFSIKYSIPHFMWLHGQDAKLSNQYVKRIKPLGSEVIAISDFIKEEFYKNHGISPFLVAENGITESDFPELNTKERRIDILGVGSLIPVKDYDLFIHIIKEVHAQLPFINVAIIGKGNEEQRLKQLVQKLKLNSTIHFLGSLAHPEVLSIMNSSKILLHTSSYEGNSTVIAEALYAGCKVVSTCALRNTKVQNLAVLKSKKEISEKLIALLNNEIVSERILFNSMDNTAKKIINLFNK